MCVDFLCKLTLYWQTKLKSVVKILILFAELLDVGFNRMQFQRIDKISVWTWSNGNVYYPIQPDNSVPPTRTRLSPRCANQLTTGTVSVKLHFSSLFHFTCMYLRCGNWSNCNFIYIDKLLTEIQSLSVEFLTRQIRTSPQLSRRSRWNEIAQDGDYLTAPSKINSPRDDWISREHKLS